MANEREAERIKKFCEKRLAKIRMEPMNEMTELYKAGKTIAYMDIITECSIILALPPKNSTK